MPASFQSPSSAICVPDLSPREMNGARLVLQRVERSDDVTRSFDAGRIASRADQNEVVIHHGIALHAEALGQEFFLGRFGMHEYHVGVTAPSGVERLASPLRHHLHVDAGLRLEQRQDVAEQS